MKQERDGGVYFGLTADKHRNIVTYGEDRQVLLYGPNGSGKDTGVIIPQLARTPTSVLVLDPKGEAAAITARWRAKHFGRVIIMNPFDVLVDTHPWLKSTGFNPLATIDADDDKTFTDDCEAISLGVIREVHGGDGAFFSGSAQDLVTALIMYDKLLEKRRPGYTAHLGNVRRMLTEPFGGTQDGPTGLAKTIFDMCHSNCEPLRFKAGRFMNGSRSTMDVIATAVRDSNFLDSPPLRRDLAKGGFSFADMKEECITTYVIMPADKLDSHSGWLRMIVSAAVQTMMRTPPSKTRPRPLFIINEAGQLGHLKPLAAAMGIARGFGVTLMTCWQSHSQMEFHYGKRAQTFVGARGALASFAPKDWQTAEMLSKLCGNRSEFVTSYSGKPGDLQQSETQSQQGFPLFRPEDLMRLPPGVMLDLVEPVAYPFLTYAPGYWNLPWCSGLDPNPYYSAPLTPSAVGYERLRQLRERRENEKAKPIGPD